MTEQIIHQQRTTYLGYLHIGIYFFTTVSPLPPLSPPIYTIVRNSQTIISDTMPLISPECKWFDLSISDVCKWWWGKGWGRVPTDTVGVHTKHEKTTLSSKFLLKALLFYGRGCTTPSSVYKYCSLALFTQHVQVHCDHKVNKTLKDVVFFNCQTKIKW